MKIIVFVMESISPTPLKIDLSRLSFRHEVHLNMTITMCRSCRISVSKFYLIMHTMWSRCNYRASLSTKNEIVFFFHF